MIINKDKEITLKCQAVSCKYFNIPVSNTTALLSSTERTEGKSRDAVLPDQFFFFYNILVHQYPSAIFTNYDLFA
jgi:hypothetical protein